MRRFDATRTAGGPTAKKILALCLAAALLIPLAAHTSRSASVERAGCSLALGKLSTPGCNVVAKDTGTRRNPKRVWHSIDCQRRTRVRRVRGGSHSSFRQLRVMDGDDFYGERCELGRNSHVARTFNLYREGQRRITFASFRLAPSFKLGGDRWQHVLQMKQAQPSANGGNAPVLTLSAFRGRWRLMLATSNTSLSMQQLWSTEARKGRWARFAFDVVYSQNSSIGSVKVYADLNHDGDTRDRHEQSRTYRRFTLKRETTGGGDDGIAPGESIPSHLRVGIYHDPAYRCPRPRGCALDVDDVKVVKPR